VTALETTRAKLVSVLRSLAKLAACPTRMKTTPAIDRGLRLALQVYQEFARSGSCLKLQVRVWPARRERLEAVGYTVQMFFLTSARDHPTSA